MVRGKHVEARKSTGPHLAQPRINGIFIHERQPAYYYYYYYLAERVQDGMFRMKGVWWNLRWSQATWTKTPS